MTEALATLPLPNPLLSGDGLEEVLHLMSQLAMGTRLERAGHMVQEHLATGGRRVRARLALAAGEALGRTREQMVPWAAACELMHNATLIHDDIQDEDRQRRDQPTVWVRHGISQAINAGDLLLMLPFTALENLQAPSAVRWALCRALARRAEATVRGQSLEMDLLTTSQFSRQHYNRSALGKSGALLALPVEGAALIAGLEPTNAAALAAPFEKIGLLFQLQDDVLDLYGDKGRGEVGSDIREGKVSALVVEHLALYPEDREWLAEILAAPRERTRLEDVEEVIRRFRDGGALESVLSEIDTLHRQVDSHPLLRAVPDLFDVAQDLIRLSLTPIASLMNSRIGEAK